MVSTYWSSPWRPPPWSVPLLVLTSCFLSESITPFPKDLEPISVVASEQSYQFPVFQGLLQDNDTVRLGLDFQRLLRINHMLYIAARDHVFAVNLTTASEDFVPRLKLTWRSEDVSKCTVRGKNSDECYNYVKVLVPRNDETLFACGTNAFNPTCRNYKMSSLQQVGDEVGGQARCPFESGQSNVGLFAGGDFYSATMTDFLASDAVLYRSLGASSVLRTVKYDSKWLREPHFLHAIDYGNYVYFFLSEIAVENTALGKVVFSRVARVCKNDDGGSPRVLERHWTSFLKARLNCSLPGDSFFYFDVLRSLSGVLQVNRRPAVVGVFTTQANSIPGSAVCAFYLDDIEKAFGGRFKAQRGADAAWTPVPEEQVPRPRPGACAGDGPAADFRSSVQFPDETLAFIKAHPLMHEAVPAVNQRPCFTRTSSRSKLTQIAVDASAGPFKDRTVVFLGSDEGRVLKVLASTRPDDGAGSRLLEDIDVYNPSRCDVQGQQDRRVLGLELDKDHQALFVAFSSCVVRVPLARCRRHGACRGACLASRDPYCIWLRTGSCANMAPGIKAGFDQDIEGDHAPAPPPPDGCHDNVLTTTQNQESAADSAYGVRRPLEAERLPYTLLLACVLLAFLLGAVSSGLLVSCCCGNARRLGRDEEAHAMSLRTLAKLQQEEDQLGVSTLRMYSSFIPPGLRALSLSQADGELSGLPTPASSPEPASRNTPALNASSSSLHLPEEASHEGRGGGGAAGGAPPPSALDELLLHLQEVSASGTGGIKVLTCTSSSSMFHGPSAGGGRPPHYHRGPQRRLPETSSSSSSTPLQVIPETRLLSQRHSLIKMGAVPHHHSFNHQGALARMNTNSSSNGPPPGPPGPPAERLPDAAAQLQRGASRAAGAGRPQNAVVQTSSSSHSAAPPPRHDGTGSNGGKIPLRLWEEAEPIEHGQSGKTQRKL